MYSTRERFEIRYVDNDAIRYVDNDARLYVLVTNAEPFAVACLARDISMMIQSPPRSARRIPGLAIAGPTRGLVSLCPPRRAPT